MLKIGNRAAKSYQPNNAGGGTRIRGGKNHMPPRLEVVATECEKAFTITEMFYQVPGMDHVKTTTIYN
jgi:hypothetical protein